MNPLSFTLRARGGLLRVLLTDADIYYPNVGRSTRIKAIWDTGATGSAITTKVVRELGLLPTGKVEVHTAAGPVLQNTYTIDVRLPNGVLIQGIIATEVDALSGGGADALVGMDIITLGDLSITNHKGNTCMSFRIPSLHEIDFVKSPNFGVVKVTTPINVGRTPSRNEKCPCGSGKLYKRCHGKTT